jgi:lipopolysaccharide biosynthesis glycosyltransferase
MSHNETVLVVIISDRPDGIIPTIASILQTSSVPVEVVLIGVHSVNDQVQRHFGSRLQTFTSLSVADVTRDLQTEGHDPIWTWPDWHSSVNNPAWHNENTLHVGTWDHLPTHAHELNHVRFYLPYLSIFKHKPSFFFLDDDVIVRRDLAVLSQLSLVDLPRNKGLVGPCNIWTWNSSCFQFEFQSQKDYILDMPSLYGDREVCQTESESHCVPENYWDFVRDILPENGTQQHAWNFGFSLFALENWRALDLTSRYETVMRESYRRHVFPETSLTFGLGVAYIAFAGAVECWNEQHVKVRDGFGFIELDRYEATFGKDFMDSQVDVMHFTGPDKPWVPNSRIEPWAVQPWLDLMEAEKLPLPPQLPADPTTNLVTIIASEYTGIDYVMSTLDKHPELCASGEHDRPETGFPMDSLHPDGLDWVPTCSIRKGCTFGFVDQSVLELLSFATNDGETPRQCEPEYDPIAKNDPLQLHLPRICKFIEKLDNRYDEAKLARLWVDAFITEDKSLLGCSCPRGVKAKVLKVLPEWMTFYWDEMANKTKINLNHTNLHGSKVIRLHRRNLWARYKAMMTAVKTGFYLPASPAEKKTQLDTLQQLGNLTIDMHHLEWHMLYMQAMDRAGDEWAKEHASDVLSLVYEDCLVDTKSCFEEIYRFVGVDTAPKLKSKHDLHSAMFVAYDEIEESMEYVSNAFEIREKLGVHGWDHFVTNEQYRPIQLLLYLDNEMLKNTRHYLGVNTTIFGMEQKGETKWSGAVSILKQMADDAIVVLGDLSSMWVNMPLGGDNVTVAALGKFRETLDSLYRINPGAVIVSAQVHCCSNGLSRISPGDLFDKRNKRKRRSCKSGDDDCEWQSKSKAAVWQAFMTKLAKQRSSTSSGRDFLDAGLIAGRAGDLLHVLQTADIGEDEDEQTVLTDFMYHNPDKIILDYDQFLLGEADTAATHTALDTCLTRAEGSIKSRRLTEHSKGSIFMRTPRRLECKVGKSPPDSPTATFPAWGKEGIQFTPIIDHIKRVIAKEDIIVVREDYRHSGVDDYPQGPELLYIIDDKGVWTSRAIRDRTDNVTFFARLDPSEKLTLLAHKLLLSEDVASTRWPALKRSVQTGGVPYWSWYGDFKICNYHNHRSDSIPVFTTCARTDCNYAWPMPNYMSDLDSQLSYDNWLGFFRESERDYPWKTKIRKAVWRGSLSEADGDKIFTSIRWRMAKHIHELKSSMFDFGLTHIPAWVQGNREIDLAPVGGLKTGITPMNAFQQYTAIMDMDGNSWSSRFGTLLCYNSVVIKVEPQYVDYFYPELKPWVHFIPVRDDLSDLVDNVAWALDPKNDNAVQRIISSANQWCSKRFIPEELARDQLDIMEAYVGQLDRADTKWQQSWHQKRKQISSPSSPFDIMQLR